MEKSTSSVLKALKAQVLAGLAQKADASIKAPIPVIDVLNKAEAAKNELPGRGLRR